MLFETQRLQEYLIQLCEPLGCSAVVLPDGRALHVRHEKLVDISTLPLCAQMALQYLQLKDGDVALLNDPFTGGAFWADVTLVTAVAFSDGTKPDVLLAHRFSLKPRFEVIDTVVEKGLHMPPTPIANGGRLNQGLFEAVQSHPDCPPDFGILLERGFHLLMKARRQMKASAASFGIDWNRNQIRDFFADGKTRVQKALSELPSSEYTLQTSLETGERIKLHLEITDEKVIFDFAGTDNSPHFHITHQATFGICYGALMAALALTTASEPPVNSAGFQLVEVRTPSECFLNARAPASTLLGALVGAPIVAQLLLRAIGQIVPRMRGGVHAAAPSLIGLDFEKHGTFFDSIPGGMGGFANAKGEDAMSFWSRSTLRPSIEEVERRLPLLVRTISSRSLSGGLGLHRGGHGLVKTYECLAEGRLHWWVENTKLRPEGYKGAKDGALSEIYITRKNERLDLEAYGSTTVHPGDLVTIMTAGGGGFEVAPTPPA